MLSQVQQKRTVPFAAHAIRKRVYIRCSGRQGPSVCTFLTLLTQLRFFSCMIISVAFHYKFLCIIFFFFYYFMWSYVSYVYNVRSLVWMVSYFFIAWSPSIRKKFFVWCLCMKMHVITRTWPSGNFIAVVGANWKASFKGYNAKQLKWRDSGII